MVEQCVEYVNLSKGKLFVEQGRHLARPERQAECLGMLAKIENAPCITADDRAAMGLPADADYRIVRTWASVSGGIGSSLTESTRLYGSLYLQAFLEFRQALFEDTASAWDLSCAYQTFMCMISQRPLTRVRELTHSKHMVRAMVAAAYNVSLDSAKKLLP